MKPAAAAAAAPPLAPKAVTVVSIGVISGVTGTGCGGEGGGGSVYGTSAVDINPPKELAGMSDIYGVVPVLIVGVDSLVAVLTVLSDTVDCSLPVDHRRGRRRLGGGTGQRGRAFARGFTT